MNPCTAPAGSSRPRRCSVQHARELLGVERVPAGALEEPGLRLGGEHGPLEQRRHE